MDGPELIARDLALLATTNPEAFWSALHELHDALAKVAHPDAGLMALGAELRALCEAVHAGPADAALEEADERLAAAEGARALRERGWWLRAEPARNGQERIRRTT